MFLLQSVESKQEEGGGSSRQHRAGRQIVSVLLEGALITRADGNGSSTRHVDQASRG